MSASTNYDVYPRISNSQQQSGAGAFALVVTAGGVDAPGAATKYFTIDASANHAAAAVKLFLATRACTIQNLYVSCQTAPGGSDTGAFTVQVSTDQGATWTDTALTCTVTGTATSGSDTTHRVAVAAGSLLAIKNVSSGATLAKCAGSFEVA